MSDTSTPNDGRADFDFVFGSWKVHNRRLRERLRGSDSWEEFEGFSVARPILGGLGNIDEITMHRESGVLEGFTIRLFNPAAQEWSIYWADSLSGLLYTPMIGRFENDRGEFYAHEPFEGRHIISRFIWVHPTPDACRWEQSFSPDGGKTWEVNWVMEMTRQA